MTKKFNPLYFLRYVEGEQGGSGEAPKEEPKPKEEAPEPPKEKPKEEPKPKPKPPEPAPEPVNERGYPENTPIKEMTSSEQAAYWKHQSRRNESMLKSSVPQSDFDRVQSRLVRESIRASVAGRVSDETIDEQLEFADHSRFLTEDGDVDAEKVNRYASNFRTENPKGNGPSDKRAWQTGPSGAVGDPGGNPHSVRAAKEAHSQKLNKK